MSLWDKRDYRWVIECGFATFFEEWQYIKMKKTFSYCYFIRTRMQKRPFELWNGLVKWVRFFKRFLMYTVWFIMELFVKKVMSLFTKCFFLFVFLKSGTWKKEQNFPLLSVGIEPNSWRLFKVVSTTQPSGLFHNSRVTISYSVDPTKVYKNYINI